MRGETKTFTCDYCGHEAPEDSFELAWDEVALMSVIACLDSTACREREEVAEAEAEEAGS